MVSAARWPSRARSSPSTRSARRRSPNRRRVERAHPRRPRRGLAFAGRMFGGVGDTEVITTLAWELGGDGVAPGRETRRAAPTRTTRHTPHLRVSCMCARRVSSATASGPTSMPWPSVSSACMRRARYTPRNSTWTWPICGNQGRRGGPVSARPLHEHWTTARGSRQPLRLSRVSTRRRLGVERTRTRWLCRAYNSRLVDKASSPKSIRRGRRVRELSPGTTATRKPPARGAARRSRWFGGTAPAGLGC